MAVEAKEAKGFVRRVLLVKFKDETPPDQMEQLIKRYSNLVNLVESLKSWHMGKDVSIENSHKVVSIENLHEGFTHVFDLTFESVEGIAEYMVHPAYLEFHELFRPLVEKIAVIDYKPTAVMDYKPTPFRNPN